MKINVLGWSYTSPPGALYSFAYPYKFEIEQCAEALTPELIRKIANMIGSAQNKDAYAHAFSFSSRIPYNNLAIADSDNAAFVLLEETPVIGGMSWKEAVYILQKNGSKIKGKVYTIGNGASYESWATHYRYTIRKENGKIILKMETRDKHSQGPITIHESEISFTKIT